MHISLYFIEGELLRFSDGTNPQAASFRLSPIDDLFEQQFNLSHCCTEYLGLHVRFFSSLYTVYCVCTCVFTCCVLVLHIYSVFLYIYYCTATVSDSTSVDTGGFLGKMFKCKLSGLFTVHFVHLNTWQDCRGFF